MKAGTKLLDFGLAKSTGPARSGHHVLGGGHVVGDRGVRLQPDLSALPTVSAAVTAEGTILGTFQYMAPEQLEGKDADARTDIFAFGAKLYDDVDRQEGVRATKYTSGPFPTRVANDRSRRRVACSRAGGGTAGNFSTWRRTLA